MNQLEAKQLEKIRQGDRTALHEIYLQHRSSFLEWAGARYNCDEEMAKDIWQEVVIIFYENTVEGKLTELNSQLRTYLFGIGRNLILRKLDRQGRKVKLEDEEETLTHLLIDHTSDDWELNERQSRLQSLLKKLGNPCYELLQLFYYQRFTMESIMQRMGYKSPTVVKSQKARCMRNIRKQLAGYSIEDF
jgi:RNA polymerase sigma factor (sigma-70 family)